jgi:hypothetical protein
LLAQVPQALPPFRVASALARLKFLEASDVTEYCAGHALKFRTKQEASRGSCDLLGRL